MILAAALIVLPPLSPSYAQEIESKTASRIDRIYAIASMPKISRREKDPVRKNRSQFTSLMMSGKYGSGTPPRVFLFTLPLPNLQDGQF
jgi:hypothetical protein